MSSYDGAEREVVAGPTDSLIDSFVQGDVQDNYLIATLGTPLLDGVDGDDILEDHDAEALLFGGSGNDRLISRNGRDNLWGGNTFGLTTCADLDDGEQDENSNSCSDYVL